MLRLLALALPLGIGASRLQKSRLAQLRGQLVIDKNVALHDRELTARESVRKPVTDNREYVHTTFDSGLHVLVVKDTLAEKAAYAVSVEAGSLEDPQDFPGLAHFLEHMVFLGSKKYPNPDDFSQHLALYNGYHNAYTAAGETVYYNEVGYEGLEKGLDVFAQFFIAPTLDEAMVNKEIHAVDSEHKKNMPDTKWQIYHLLEAVANPKNPMSKFSTGNLETLKTKPESEGKSLVTALKTFHKEHYCSQKLHMVMVANMSTDAQLELAHKYFDAIPKTDEKSCKPRATYYDAPAYAKDQDNLGHKYTVATHGSPQMWVFFPTIPLKEHYRSLPESYISNAAGHWGPGSLKALLTELDLVQSYGFHADNSVAGSKLLFTFALTPKGLKDPNLVLEKFFAYFNMMKKNDVDQKVMTSMKGLRKIDFDYQEKQSSENAFVSQLAGATPNYAPGDILAGGYLIMDEDKDLVKKVLSSITPDNMNVILVDPTFDESKGNKHEKYYDFKYLDEPIKTNTMTLFASAKDDKLKSPPALDYVPTKTDLIKDGAGGKPKKVLDEGRLHMWWMGMNAVKLPKASISIKVGYPAELTRRVDGNVLASMHSRIVYHILEEPTDDMLMCGMSYSVGAHTDGLAISFGGFDQHIESLIAAVLPTVRKPQFKDEDFEMVRRDMIQGLSDITRTQPYGHAQHAMEVVTVKGAFSRQELLAMSQDTKKVNVDTYKKFLGEVFGDAHMTLLFAGNVDQARAEKITKMVEEKLEMKDLRSAKKEELEVTRLAVLKPKEEVEIRIENPIPDDPNHATIAAYQFGVPTIADRAHLSLLSGMIERPVFETLRTKHQLGYVVFGYATLHQNIAEVQVLVQGFRENPDAVDLLIEGTLQNITKHLETVQPAEIETRKQSLITSYSQKPTSMSAEAGKYWGPIWDETYCFNKKELLVKYLQSNKISDNKPLLEMWKKITTQSAERKKVVVKLFGKYEGEKSDLNAERQGHKVVKLIDSQSVEKQMEDEKYWPTNVICEDASL
jgi:insulysin